MKSQKETPLTASVVNAASALGDNATPWTNSYSHSFQKHKNFEVALYPILTQLFKHPSVSFFLTLLFPKFFTSLPLFCSLTFCLQICLFMGQCGELTSWCSLLLPPPIIILRYKCNNHFIVFIKPTKIIALQLCIMLVYNNWFSHFIMF